MRTVYEVTTNEGTFLCTHVSPETLEKRMWEYIREKKKAGYALADIFYCWTTKTVKWGAP